MGGVRRSPRKGHRETVRRPPKRPGHGGMRVINGAEVRAKAERKATGVRGCVDAETCDACVGERGPNNIGRRGFVTGTL